MSEKSKQVCNAAMQEHSYLNVLAKRAIEPDCILPLLASRPDLWRRYIEVGVFRLDQLQGFFEDHPEIEDLIQKGFHLARGARESKDAFLKRLAGEVMGREVPDGVGDLGPEYAHRKREAIPDHTSMIHLLEKDPQLQELLAFALDYVPSRWLLEQEIAAIAVRRARRSTPCKSLGAGANAYEWARENKVTGLCLSGGGIRSATFNLGVLQGLAAEGLLGNFDYLSSVSGGGYIHEWLAGWIKREDCRLHEARVPFAYRTGFDAVTERLKPLPGGPKQPFAPEPIRWLRRYSNYLTPQKGLFTADTWVAFAIWLRNTFLNQIVLISGLFVLVLLPHLIAGGERPVDRILSPTIWVGPKLVALVALWHANWGRCSWTAAVLFAVATGVLCAGLHQEHESVRSFDKHGRKLKDWRLKVGEKSILFLVICPLLVASFLLTHALVNGAKLRPTLISIGVLEAVQLVTMAFAGGVLRASLGNHGLLAYPNDPEKKQLSSKVLLTTALTVLGVLLAGCIAACGAVCLAWLTGALLKSPDFSIPHLSEHLPHLPQWIHETSELSRRPRVLVTVGPPLLLLAPFFSMVLMAGLVGRNFPDWLREWIARVRALCALTGLLWIAYSGVTLIGPSLLYWQPVGSKWVQTLGHSIKWTAALGWLGTTAGSVLAGRSSKASGAANDSSVGLNVLAEAGPYVFIVGLLLVLSRFADSVFFAACRSGQYGYLVVLVPLAIFGLFGWRVDINEFSMNPFYRNRLTRCYLGATNTERSPNPLTGFDDRDTRGMQISTLQPKNGYSGPLPIINTTLNLSFGEDLAWQERKAASFFFSPLFSGYTVGWTAGKVGTRLSFNGFVPTAKYCTRDGGMNVATAVAISGAAASPNSGFHTNPGTAFLMTVFNVRLGWWLFNPRRSKLAGCVPDCESKIAEWPSPRFAPLQLMRELLGMANDTSRYVYLSDGGHFDNMGLYELVRRRCYRILICDAESDKKYTFEGLGMAIRKCRIDFGVEIAFKDMARLRQALKSGDCKSHFVQGTIRYPETPEHKEAWGTVIYLKSSLTGAAKFEADPEAQPGRFTSLDAESVDILNYKLQHQWFPHDTTGNQWFTESQFESYRRLGQHVVEEIQWCSGWEEFR